MKWEIESTAGTKTIISLTERELRIKKPMRKEVVIPLNRIIEVHHTAPTFHMASSTRIVSKSPIKIHHKYMENGRRKTITITGYAEDLRKYARKLQKLLPEKVFLGPNEIEREKILNPNWKGVYPLRLFKSVSESASLLVDAGFYLFVFFPLIGVVSITIFFPAGMIPGLILLTPLVLYMARVIYVVKTTSDTIKLQKLIVFRKASWKDIKVSKMTQIEEDNVNTFTDIKITVKKDGKERIHKIRMSAKTASKFAKELYYRGIINDKDALFLNAFVFIKTE